MGSIKEKIIRVLSLNVVLWLLMLLVFSGLLLCTAGIYIWLAEHYTQVEALLLSGGGLIGVVAILLIGVMLSSRSKPASAQGKASEDKPVNSAPDNAIEHQLRPLLGNQATDWAKRNSGVAIAGALTAGVILAASPRARALIAGAAGPIFTRKAMQMFERMTDN